MNTHVDFETAKLLKEKGFDIPVLNYRLEGKYSDYVHEGFEDEYWGDNRIVNWNKDIIGIKPFKGFISAPTIAEVVMWLYEKHGIWVYTYPDGRFHEGWYFGLYKKAEHYYFSNYHSEADYNSPTEAYQAAIKHCLTKLI